MTSPWFTSLQPASFRGVKFVVRSGKLRVGRRNAVHEYPTRDDIWVEDLGRGVRRLNVVGFIVGDDYSARDAMIKAAEAPGDGKLIHPTLGDITVSLLDLQIGEDMEHGRVFTLEFFFLQAGKNLFPGILTSTGDATGIAAANADAAASADFALETDQALRKGSAVIQEAMLTSQQWARRGEKLVNDATNLYTLVVDLPGSYGRFASGRLKGLKQTVTQAANVELTIPDLIAMGARARINFATAAASLAAAASQISADPDAYCTAAQEVAAAVLGSAADPASGLRILDSLSGFTTVPATGIAPVSIAIAVVRATSEVLFRRASLVALARATIGYQPFSYDDAAATRDFVCGLLDAEILAAGDAGDDATYGSLRSVRTAVSQDLTTRGATLAVNTLVETPSPVPSLVLAQRLYRDPARSDELITESDCVHPAFMPTSFLALSQ